MSACERSGRRHDVAGRHAVARGELVTTGAYRWLRHPIYVAFIAIMALVLVISANWILGLSGLALVTSIAAVRVPMEERELRERFGDAWEQYARRTRWFLA